MFDSVTYDSILISATQKKKGFLFLFFFFYIQVREWHYNLDSLRILYLYVKLFKTFGTLKIFIMNYLRHPLLLCESTVVENSSRDTAVRRKLAVRLLPCTWLRLQRTLMVKQLHSAPAGDSLIFLKCCAGSKT